MISQLHMAKSAFFAFQRKMQVIANNIANSQTVGYKSRRVEMESIFPLTSEKNISEFDEVAGPTNRKRKRYLEYGQGVSITGISKNFNTGTIEVTNQPLDFAIEGLGFFQIRQSDGTLSYSRSGNFHMDAEGNILDSNGRYLEPPIKIPRNVTEVIVNEEGRVYVRLNNQTQPSEVGQVMLAKFPNPEGLQDVGSNMYKETMASGEAEFSAPGREGMGVLRQRSLEFSNVNIVEEMMNMLLTQRAFELVTKTINSADSMLKIASDISK